MTNEEMQHRRFFHSFPRPRSNDSNAGTLERGLAILESIKQVGLVLAPEMVSWDVSPLGIRPPHVDILQRRISFTELSIAELPGHSKTFGPIAMSFDIAKLRSTGAIPVIYVPQGVADDPLSLIPAFCAHGVWHTKHVLSQLQGLKVLSDPVTAPQQLGGLPVSPDCEITLRNPVPPGNVGDAYKIRASDILHFLQYVGSNNIPFDHSAAILDYYLNIFYPTDNTHTADQLGYYRQREWRLVASNFRIKGRPISRALTDVEVTTLEKLNSDFWTHEISVDGVQCRRSKLAVVYDPVPNFNVFDILDEVFVPAEGLDHARRIVGDSVRVFEQP